jgi:hypothetical protein
MRLTNEFTVPAPADRVWAVLLDVGRVAPSCPAPRWSPPTATSTGRPPSALDLNVAARDAMLERAVPAVGGLPTLGILALLLRRR